LSACSGGGDTIVNSEGATTTGINVSGTGRASGTPDTVVLQLGVQAEARTVAEARDLAARAAQGVIDSLKKNGVDDRDIRTVQFDIQPQFDAGVRGTPTVRAYRVSNVLSVKVRKIDNAGKVIDDAAAAGGNNTVVQSIAFSIDDPTKLEARAREAAVKEARDKAEQLAKLGGVKLGNPITITEGGGPQPIFINAAALVAPRTGGDSTPIQSGQLDVTITVSVLYRIE